MQLELELQNQENINKKIEYIKELIVTCRAPIQVKAVSRKYSSFIAIWENRTVLFTYSTDTAYSRANWLSKKGAIRKECYIDRIDENYEVVSKELHYETAINI